MYSTTLERQKDRAEIARETGFTGTFRDFLSWLDESLVYGGVVFHDEVNEHGRPVIKVETITGGYSSDERLLGRVSRSIYLSSSWVSSHRGGLEVYEFPKSWIESDDEYEFLAPEDGVFERVHRARRILVYGENGDFFQLSYTAGAELVFQEPDRDINEPEGMLAIRPIAQAPEREITHAAPKEAPDVRVSAPAPVPARVPVPAPPKTKLVPALVAAKEKRAEERPAKAAYRGPWRFTNLARGQISALGLTEDDLAAILDAPHTQSPTRNGTAMNHYDDRLLIMVDADGACVISVIERFPQSNADEVATPASTAGSTAKHKSHSGGAGRRMPSNTKELLAMLKEHGFSSELGGKGHHLVTHPAHPDVRIAVPSSPSDHRSLPNAVADIKRRTGIDITKKEV